MTGPHAAIADVSGPLATDGRLSTASRPPNRRRGLPIGAWIAIAGAGAFGISMAAMLGSRWLGQTTPQGTPSSGESPAVAPPTTPSAPVVVPDPSVGGSTDSVEQPDPTEVPVNGTKRSPRSGSSGGPATTGGPTKTLTAEELALIERFQGQGTGPAKIRVGNEQAAPRRGNGEGLTEQQLRNVLGNNQPGLRRCYEISIRGLGNPPTVRLDVSVTIELTGRVTNVSATGGELSSLRGCVEAAVRRWRFPSSGADSQTRFPVLFSPGS